MYTYIEVGLQQKLKRCVITIQSFPVRLCKYNGSPGRLKDQKYNFVNGEGRGEGRGTGF